ncbi:RES family NAD+ phosphorylase [Bradyrhizobium diazoefficiens]|nr:RES family NAD+ phosphorylase [Bradyrhizobium diazoefficiens]MBR0771060.1 RES family NAD+ phosphorylase [Bradyrhizobium diazoefficiens]
MRLWRISNFADLSGLGGLKASGRWHEKGRHVVYAADHPASALLEVMVHLEIDFEDLPTTYQLLEIDLPDDVALEAVSVADVEKISTGWKSEANITRGLLVPWFEDKRTAVVEVPSAIIPFGQNYIINPAHKDAARLTIVHAALYPHDLRLFGAARSTATG